MSIVIDKELYNLVKQKTDEVFKKPSAYKSGYILKTYKQLWWRYQDDSKTKNLKRWFKDKWEDVGRQSYPVYRPTIRIYKHTPLTVDEIDKTILKKQIKKENSKEKKT